MRAQNTRVHSYQKLWNKNYLCFALAKHKQHRKKQATRKSAESTSENSEHRSHQKYLLRQDKVVQHPVMRSSQYGALIVEAAEPEASLGSLGHPWMCRRPCDSWLHAFWREVGVWGKGCKAWPFSGLWEFPKIRGLI